MAAPLIVAVDDDQVILDLYREVLEEDEGYRVITCRIQEDAVACVRRERPDLVILDLRLGFSFGGWDVSQALANDPATAAIPIILSTAAGPSLLEPPPTLRHTPLAVLNKPFPIEDLLAAVKTALT
jgi:two-component system, OmpR family, alkaline phosphatase synthesis response regulator PhoP